MKDTHKEFKVGNLVRIKTQNHFVKQPLGIIFGMTKFGAWDGYKIRWSNGTIDTCSGINLIKVA